MQGGALGRWGPTAGIEATGDVLCRMSRGYPCLTPLVPRGPVAPTDARAGGVFIDKTARLLSTTGGGGGGGGGTSRAPPPPPPPPSCGGVEALWPGMY